MHRAFSVFLRPKTAVPFLASTTKKITANNLIKTNKVVYRSFFTYNNSLCPTNDKWKSFYSDATNQQMLDEMNTVQDILRFAVTLFSVNDVATGQGANTLREEAINLVFGALRLPAHDDANSNYLNAKVSTLEKQKIFELLKQRVNERIPTSYLLNEAWIGNYKFYVDKRTIVPRSLLGEAIVNNKLDDFLEEHKIDWDEDPEYYLDMCTGSGCLAILLAQSAPYAKIDAVDISDDALAVAAINVKNYGLEDHITLIKSDLFTNLKPKKYKMIVCNPPYVSDVRMDTLPPEFQQEPPLALAGGSDGCDVIEKVLTQASSFLAKDGIVVMECGSAVGSLIERHPRLKFHWLPTSAGNDSVFVLLRKPKQKARAKPKKQEKDEVQEEEEYHDDAPDDVPNNLPDEPDELEDYRLRRGRHYDDEY